MPAAFLIKVVPKPLITEKRLQRTTILTRLMVMSEKLPRCYGEAFLFSCLLHDFMATITQLRPWERKPKQAI
jgi:hypothetical protein